MTLPAERLSPEPTDSLQSGDPTEIPANPGKCMEEMYDIVAPVVEVFERTVPRAAELATRLVVAPLTVSSPNEARAEFTLRCLSMRYLVEVAMDLQSQYASGNVVTSERICELDKAIRGIESRVFPSPDDASTLDERVPEDYDNR